MYVFVGERMGGGCRGWLKIHCSRKKMYIVVHLGVGRREPREEIKDGKWQRGEEAGKGGGGEKSVSQFLLSLSWVIFFDLTPVMRSQGLKVCVTFKFALNLGQGPGTVSHFFLSLNFFFFCVFSCFKI